MIPLPVYAAIKADIWAGRAPLDEILERHGIDEADFRAHERHQAEVLAREAGQGRCDAARALGDAFRSQRDGATQADERERSLAEYVELQIEVDRAARPSDALAARGVAAAEWQRLRRRWRQRAAADPKLGAEMRALLAAARNAPPRAPDKPPARTRKSSL